MEIKKEFKVNDYITLRLDAGKTVIYVKGERFQQCKYLLLNIPINQISSFDEIDSINEVAEKLDKSLESIDSELGDLPPEVEFWGHCSNLQVWMEEDYDTRFLHCNLAFPLLKKLYKLGDPTAKRVFKEEIIKRLSYNHSPTILYLFEKNFLKIFTKNEWEIILFDKDLHVAKHMIQALPLIFRNDEILANYIVDKINEFQENKEFRNFLKGEILDLFMNGSDEVLIQLLSYRLYRYLNKSDLLYLFCDLKTLFISNIKKILKAKKYKYITSTDYIHYCLNDFFEHVKDNIKDPNIGQLINHFSSSLSC